MGHWTRRIREEPMPTKTRVLYTGVVLDTEDRHRLLAKMGGLLHEYLQFAGFRTQNAAGDLLCHHMTCFLGECPETERSFLGQDVMLNVVAWGMSEKAAALQVSEWTPKTIPCRNEIPHITFAVNHSRGGKPKDSNSIGLWIPMEPIVVLGRFQEVSLF